MEDRVDPGEGLIEQDEKTDGWRARARFDLGDVLRLIGPKPVNFRCDRC